MLRAIFFDFYGVWTPDRFADLLTSVESTNPSVAQELQEDLQRYYLGLLELEQLVDTFRFKLELPELETADFKLQESDISKHAIAFIQYLHTHFIKVGILANLGKYEHELLTNLDKKYKLFETIVDSFDQGAPLLTTEVFVKACRNIGEPKDSCMIVTGHEAYQQFADSLGIRTIRYSGFPNLSKTIDEFIQTDQTNVS